MTVVPSCFRELEDEEVVKSIRLPGGMVVDVEDKDDDYINDLMERFGIALDEEAVNEAEFSAMQEECITSGPMQGEVISVESQFRCIKQPPGFVGVELRGTRVTTYQLWMETEVCPGGRTHTRRWRSRIDSEVTEPCP